MIASLPGPSFRPSSHRTQDRRRTREGCSRCIAKSPLATPNPSNVLTSGHRSETRPGAFGMAPLVGSRTLILQARFAKKPVWAAVPQSDCCGLLIRFNRGALRWGTIDPPFVGVRSSLLGSCTPDRPTFVPLSRYGSMAICHPVQIGIPLTLPGKVTYDLHDEAVPARPPSERFSRDDQARCLL